MLERLRKKWKSHAGESLAEVLIAMLVSAVGLVMLAGMISASQSIVKKSQTVIESSVAGENALAGNTGTISAKISFAFTDNPSGSETRALNNKRLAEADAAGVPLPIDIKVTKKTITNHEVAAYR